MHPIQQFFGPILLATLSLGGCTFFTHSQTHPFEYRDLPIASESAQTGTGSSISFKGNSLPLSGDPITVGDSLRSVSLAKHDLSLLDLLETRGSVRIINVVPSLDTKVCEQQTHYLSEKSQGLDEQATFITISIDTPFAQHRFAEEAGITNIQFLSDFRGAEFGKEHGLLLKGPHLLTRAVMVVDSNNVLRYLQVTKNLGHMPDMEEAFRVARQLVQQPSS